MNIPEVDHGITSPRAMENWMPFIIIVVLLLILALVSLTVTVWKFCPCSFRRRGGRHKYRNLVSTVNLRPVEHGSRSRDKSQASPEGRDHGILMDDNLMAISQKLELALTGIDDQSLPHSMV